MILASNFDTLAGILFWIGVALVVLGLISFVPAARGHWLTLPLALPVACLGAACVVDFSIHSNPAMVLPEFWFLSVAPLVLGVASIILWFLRRRRSAGLASLLQCNTEARFGSLVGMSFSWSVVEDVSQDITPILGQ